MTPGRMATNLALLAGLWWLLTGGDSASWLVGLPAVAAAAWAAGRLQSAGGPPVSLPGLLLFLPFFLWESLRGGIDVMLRTLAPRMRIHPGTAEYRTGLRREDARVFFANCLCLLPGTLAADLSGDRITVHLLDARVDPGEDLKRLERAVARVYPQSL